MPLFSRFKNKGAQSTPKSKGQTGTASTNGTPVTPKPQKPRWQSTWNSTTVVPEEVEELIHVCTAEMKSRGRLMYGNAARRGGTN